MDKQEKMEHMTKAVAYARGAYNCLDCIGPGGWSGGGLNCRGGSSFDAGKLKDALCDIGLTAVAVDAATEAAGIVEGGGSLGLSENRISGCVDVDTFLEVVESLL